MKAIRFLTGAIVGAAVGATVAILMAPASGEEIRGQIQERGMSFRDELNEAAQTRRAELEKQLAQLRQPKKRSIEAEQVEV